VIILFLTVFRTDFGGAGHIDAYALAGPESDRLPREGRGGGDASGELAGVDDDAVAVADDDVLCLELEGERL